MEERYYWLAFSVCSGVGPKKFAAFLQSFGSAKDAWEADETAVREVVGPALAKTITSFKAQFSIESYQKRLVEKKVWFVTLTDPEYPALLKQIDNPPFVLFGKGDKKLLAEKHMVGIVGTRKVTTYGRQVTEMMTEELVKNGCIIVSGLALGVDAIAHQTTVERNGKTIAVLGCGVDCCYPSTNERIYNEMLEQGGTVISEFPLSMQPSVGSFPSRNRIIAGMSLATLVTEGAEDSGSLITAHNALQYGRKVFAVPGPITSSLSTGPMKLIREGGTLITNAQEIIEVLGITSTTIITGTTSVIKGDTKEEQQILDLLQHESLHFDEIAKRSNMNASQLGTILSLLEMKEYITNSPSGFHLKN